MGVPTDNVEGTYSVTHTLSAEGFGVLICSGVLVLTQQGNSFSGTVSVTAEQGCEMFVQQGPVSGTVSSTGAVSFTAALPILVGLQGCDILGGGETYTGTATSTTFSGTRTNQVRCEDAAFEGQISHTISGTKT